MKINYRTRRTLMQALSIVLVCLVAFGAIMGFSALYKKLNEETTVIKPSFKVGALNANGKYLDTDASIYTKDSFKCKGLEVKLDFDSNVKYQAYFYDNLDNFISSSSTYEESVKLTVPADAVYARLVVTPIWGDDVEKDDRVCHWYDVAKYAKQLEVKVLKEQEAPEYIDVALWEEFADLDLAYLSSENVHEISPLSLEYASFLYSQNHFEDTVVTKIGVPVNTIVNPSQKNTFTVYVVKEANEYKTVDIVKDYTLTIDANEYSVSTVNEWVYFDVDIPVGEGETLMFGAKTDTIIPHYSRNGNESGTLIWKANTPNSVLFSTTGSLLFDIYVGEEK